MIHINLLAVLVAALAAFIIGFMFHGPFLGKLWMKLANIVPTGKEKFSDMYGKMFWNYVVNVITALVLSILFVLTATSPFITGGLAWHGAVCGFLAWITIGAATSIDTIWMGKSCKLWFFEVCSSFVVMMVMGMIVAVWR